MDYATYTNAADSVVPDRSQQTLDSVFQSFKKHCSAERIQTNVVVLEAIRETHPDQQVTVISARSCDLIGFAAAGYAQAHCVAGADSFSIVRTYHPPPSRLSADEVEWHDTLIGQQKYFYVLSAKTAFDSPGRAPLVEPLLVTCGKWTTVLHNEVYVFDSGFWTKSRELYSEVRSVSWEDVILDPSMKQNLVHDVCTFFDSRNTYEEYSMPWKRGVILHGIPGCGKTMSIKALMNDMSARNVASLYVKSFDGCQGPKRSIRDIFAHARTMAPCLLIFEDLDSLVRDEVRSYFLNEVDGLENNHGIFMIGSTNHIERLDPSISKRPSRFDRKYHFKSPGEHERFLYCQYWQRKFLGTGKIDFDDEMCRAVVDMTSGYTFAYMKELFVQSLMVLVTGRTDLDKQRSREDSGVSDMPVEYGDSSIFIHIIQKQAEALMQDIDASTASECRASEPWVRPRNDDSVQLVDPKMLEALEQAKGRKRDALLDLK